MYSTSAIEPSENDAPMPYSRFVVAVPVSEVLDIALGGGHFLLDAIDGEIVGVTDPGAR